MKHPYDTQTIWLLKLSSMVFIPNKIWGLFSEFKVGFISNFVLQWNLYKAITRCCGLSREVVFHDMEIKHDFGKDCAT